MFYGCEKCSRGGMGGVKQTLLWVGEAVAFLERFRDWDRPERPVDRVGLLFWI